MTDAERALQIARKNGVLRPRDLAEEGIARTQLQRLVAKGSLLRIGRGLYVASDQEPTLHSSLAAAAHRVPQGVICLLSALRFHKLTTQSPHQVWIAVPARAHPPKSDGVPFQVVKMAPGPLGAGIEKHTIDGVAVPIFDPAKTVADCFRFRNRIGMDVALEAMRDYLQRKTRDLDLLLEHAKVNRVRNSIQPYLESML